MGEVTLKISADVQGALKGTEDLNKSVDELNKDTQAYNQKATQGFNQTGQAATTASQGVSKASQAFKTLSIAVAGAFSVGAIVQWGKAIAASTGEGGDAMARFEEGTKRAFQALNAAIATADFSNLITGLRDAFEEGQRYADVLDEIKARQVALGAFKATLETQQAEQKLVARNAKNSIEVRQAAIDEIIRLEKLKLSETLSLQNTELDEALRAAAVRTNINIKDEEELKARKLLVEEWARAYGTVEGVNKLNEQLARANDLQAGLDALITRTQLKSGGFITDYSKRDAAVLKLSTDEKRLLDLREINTVITDEERDNINKAMQARSQSTTQAIDQETSLQRLRNQLMSELLGQEEKKAKADKERVKSTVEDNLESLDRYVEESNKKIFDIELGFGGTQTVEQFEKGIEDNIKGFNEAMENNPMFSDENGVQAKAFDDAQKALQDNIDLMKKQQEDALAAMQKFAEDHPIAEALGLTSEEQIAQVKDFVGQLADFANEIIDQQVEATTRIVEDQNQRIEEQEELVNREFELKKEGLANNFQVEQENLENMQKARDQAIKDREKAIKLQRTLSTIESGIALVASAANIIKGFSGIPVVGVALGLAAVGAMIAGFIIAQGKVKDAVQFAEGGLLTGKRHSEGGIRIPGTNIEVEGNEFVTNRRATAKYLPLLEAINRDDRDGMRLFFDRKFINRMPQQRLNFDIDSSKKLNEIAKNTRKNNSEIIYGPGYIIERVGSYTKKINLN